MLFIIALIAGLLSTFIMTFFMQLMGYRQRKSIPWLLGTFIALKLKPGPSTRQLWLLAWGNTVHYAIGIGFVALYFLLWSQEWVVHSYATIFVFGLVAGLLAISVWSVILNLHPLKAFISYPSFLVSIFISHLIFAFSMASFIDVSMIFLLDPQHYTWMFA